MPQTKFTSRQVGDLQLTIDINRQGFVDLTETSLSFNDSTYQFTLTDTGSGWSYYRSGLRYTISGNKTVTLAGSPPTSGLYYIYIDATDGTLTASGTEWTLLDSKVPVASIDWNNSLTPKYWLSDERHTIGFDSKLHWYIHTLEGAKLATVPTLAGYTLDTDTDTAKTFSISACTLVDQDIAHNIALLTDPDGTSTDYVIYYRTGASTWQWIASAMPFPYNIGNANNWIQWDNAGTLTDATGGAGSAARWVNSYLLITNMTGAARHVIVPGRAIYTSLANAQSENITGFTWDGFEITEAVIAYRLTWSTITSTSKGQCQLAAVAQINISTVTNVSSGAGVDHNSLSNLQGGTTSEYYHLTSSEYTGTGTGDFVRATSPTIATPTIAKIANLTSNGFVYTSGGDGTLGEYTGTQATAQLDLFSTSTTTKGLVPGSNSVGATYYLDGSGSWSVPPGGVSATGTPVDNQFAVWTNATTLEGTTSASITATQTTFGTYVFNTDQTVGVGTDNYVLTYDNGTGEIGLEAATGGGNVSNTGTPANDQIAVWTNATTIEGTSNLSLSTTQFKAGNFVFNVDQTVGAGQDNYVLTYDNGTGEIGLEAAAGGDTLLVTAAPGSDHTASGLTIVLTANEGQNFGDAVFINSTGKAQLGDADAIATASCVAMCTETVTADNTATYLLQGIARDDTWTWTVGGLIYLTVTGTTGNTLSQTMPSGTNDVVQILGVATHADRMLFKPQLVQIELV